MAQLPLPSCPEASRFLALARARQDDRLSVVEKKSLSGHLAVCPACRKGALEIDPTLLFSPLASPPEAAAGEGAELSRRVRAVLEADRTKKRMRIVRMPALRWAAVFAFGIGLTAIVALRTERRGVDLAGSAPMASVAKETDAGRRSTPLVEIVAGAHTQVYQFAPDRPDQPSVVFVVDRNADL